MTVPEADRWTRLARSKEGWAREGRLLTGRRADPATDRLPPGQRLVRDWPVLDLGTQPVIPMREWRFAAGGLCARTISWTGADFLKLPVVQTMSDIHCVTGWSVYDNLWQGVSGAHLLALLRPRPEARFAIVKSFDSYTTCVPIEHLADPATLLATHRNGEPLTRAHGGPVRLIVPKLYLWKSAKWIRQIWLTDAGNVGYWEARGYHRRGDPWAEERYGR